jgi:hypothetical protein
MLNTPVQAMPMHFKDSSGTIPEVYSFAGFAMQPFVTSVTPPVARLSLPPYVEGVVKGEVMLSLGRLHWEEPSSSASASPEHQVAPHAPLAHSVSF